MESLEGMPELKRYEEEHMIQGEGQDGTETMPILVVEGGTSGGELQLEKKKHPIPGKKNKNRIARRESCLFCQQTFCSYSSLERHFNLHTGERPYQCDNCNYDCIQEGHLRRHKKSCKGKTLKDEGTKKSTSEAVKSGVSGAAQLQEDKMPPVNKSQPIDNKTPGDSSKTLQVPPTLGPTKQNKKAMASEASQQQLDRSSFPEMVYLPPDDPRSLQSANLYPPLSQQSSNDRPAHPTNLFYSVNGQMMMPVLSVEYLQAMRSPPSPKPVYPDSSDWETVDEEEEGEDAGSSLQRTVRDRPFSCEICSSRFTLKKNLRFHERTRHGKLTPRMKKNQRKYKIKKVY